MKEKKFKWRFLIISLLLVAAVFMAVFWDYFIIRIAPKAVLTSALSEVFSQLETRFQDDPLLFLIKSIAPDGKYTADVQLETANALLGTVAYDMTVQTDSSTNRFFADGIASTPQKELDLSLYLDEDFLAVSSGDLVKGNYYGITYDTFAEDLRSIPLLSLFVSDTVLAQWNDSVKSIQEYMCSGRTVPEIPEISKDDFEALLLGLLALPCETRDDSVMIDGVFLDCQTISYSISMKEINTLFVDSLYTEDSVAEVTFYLHEKALVMAGLNFTAGGRSVQYGITLGTNPAEDTLTLQRITQSSDEYDDLMIAVAANESSEGHYAETWSFTNNNSETSTYSFCWEQSSGTMSLIVNDAQEPILLNLTETEDGFCLETEDVTGLIDVQKQNKQNATTANAPIACVMTVRKGSEIITPGYKNLDEWSLEDFLTLMSGVGSVIGIVK